MTAQNFDSAIQVLSDVRPFRPFTVELVTGERFEVDHPRALANRDGVALFVKPGGVPVLFDHLSVSQIIGGRNVADEARA